MAQSISTNTFGVAKWVVSPDATQGTHTTISAALADASSGDTIWVRDGTYTENITGKDGVTIQACNEGGVANQDFVLGTVVLDGTLTISSGTCKINGLTINPTGASAVVVSGSSVTTSILTYCSLSSSGATTIVNSNSNAGTIVNFVNCSVSNTVNPSITQSGVSTFLSFERCQFFLTTSNTPAISTIDQGVWQFYLCSGGTCIVSSGTASLFIDRTGFGMNSSASPITANGGNLSITDSNFLCASSSPVVVNSPTSATIIRSLFTTNATYGISGNATNFQYSLLSMGFIGGALNVLNPTLTVQGIPTRLGNATNFTSISFADTPYTVLSTDEYISVDTSGGAISILFPDSPATGQEWTVKDATGNALLNNITITTVSGTDFIDGSTSDIIALNYGAVNLIASSSTTYQTY